jgi:glycosyltransferase involved in cell wall biosynthesis
VAGRVLRDLARSFAREGWNVTVLTTGQQASKSWDGPIRVIRVKSTANSNSMLSNILLLLKLLLCSLNLKSHTLTVTMTDPPLLIVVGRVYSYFKKSRHVHWCQDIYPDLFSSQGIKLPKFLSSFLKKLSRRSMKSCDKVIVVGRCMARYLTHGGIKPSKITVIPNWPDYDLLARNNNKIRRPLGDNAVESDVDSFRPFDQQKRSGKGHKFRVLYSGSLGSGREVETILEAARILKLECPDVEFVFVGDGIKYQKLAELRTKRELDNVRLLPYQPASSLKDMLSSGDLHLVTMNHQLAGLSVPTKLYSSLAVGRPCIFIGPENTEPAKVIKDFHAGMVISKYHPERLARIIKYYRMNSEAWFYAHDGARQAGDTFIQTECVSAWLKRARDVVQMPKNRAA